MLFCKKHYLDDGLSWFNVGQGVKLRMHVVYKILVPCLRTEHGSTYYVYRLVYFVH